MITDEEMQELIKEKSTDYIYIPLNKVGEYIDLFNQIKSEPHKIHFEKNGKPVKREWKKNG